VAKAAKVKPPARKGKGAAKARRAATARRVVGKRHPTAPKRAQRHAERPALVSKAPAKAAKRHQAGLAAGKRGRPTAAEARDRALAHEIKGRVRRLVAEIALEQRSIVLAEVAAFLR
jgi:hypothetical protein